MTPMTTDQLRDKVEGNGLEYVLSRYENEPEDNDALRTAFEKERAAMVAFDHAAAEVEKVLQISRGR